MRHYYYCQSRTRRPPFNIRLVDLYPTLVIRTLFLLATEDMPCTACSNSRAAWSRCTRLWSQAVMLQALRLAGCQHATLTWDSFAGEITGLCFCAVETHRFCIGIDIYGCAKLMRRTPLRAQEIPRIDLPFRRRRMMVKAWNGVMQSQAATRLASFPIARVELL